MTAATDSPALAPRPGPGSRTALSGWLWYVEALWLNRIDAWGVSLICGALVLITHEAFNLRTGCLLAAMALHYWLGYWLNDYFDASRDGCDPAKARHNFFVRHPASPGRVAAVALGVFALSTLPFAAFGLRGLAVLLVNGLVLWAYSAPPLRLKSRPGVDLLVHALFVQTWPYWASLWLIGAAWTPLDAALLSICFLTSLAGQLNQQVRDYAVDLRTDINFATWAGRAAAIRLLRAATVASVLLCVFVVATSTVPWFLVPYGLLGLPKFILHLIPPRAGSARLYPRPLLYATMLAALAYTGVLMLLPGFV